MMEAGPSEEVPESDLKIGKKALGSESPMADYKSTKKVSSKTERARRFSKKETQGNDEKTL